MTQDHSLAFLQWLGSNWQVKCTIAENLWNWWSQTRMVGLLWATTRAGSLLVVLQKSNTWSFWLGEKHCLIRSMSDGCDKCIKVEEKPWVRFNWVWGEKKFSCTISCFRWIWILKENNKGRLDDVPITELWMESWKWAIKRESTVKHGIYTHLKNQEIAMRHTLLHGKSSIKD